MGIDLDKEENTLIINNTNIHLKYHFKLQQIFKQYYLNTEIPKKPETKCYLKLILNNEKPFHYKPRRLSYAEKEKVQEILDELIKNEIIRPSQSEFASPIVLVRKKTGNIDYVLTTEH